MIPKFLLFDYPTEKNLFLMPTFTLRLIGFYPETPNSIYLKMWAAINFSALAYSCLAELQYGIHYSSIDSAKAMDAFCPMACSVTTLFKIFCMWYYREEFSFLIRRVRYLLEKQKSKEKLLVKQYYYSLATRLTAWVFFLATCTTIAYSIRPIFVNIMFYFQGKNLIYETPFKMLFPNVLLTMPYYPLTYIFTVWYGEITAAGFSGTDGIFLAFCLYFATLLQSLQLDIRDLLQECYDEKGRKFAKDKCIQARSRNILERHCEIAELVQKFSTVVAAFTLAHFVSSCVVIGTSVVDLLLFSDFGIVVYIVYTLAVITELFLYCIGGTAVAETSLRVGDEAYCSGWFTHDIRTQKMVLLIILRSQRSLIVRVPFFSPSLPAFISILRFTGSLVALASQFL